MDDETNQFVGMNYIAGFCPTRADFSGFNFKNESTGCFPQSTKEEVDEAIDRVEKSFEFWNSQNDKSFYLKKFFNLLIERKADFLETLSLEKTTDVFGDFSEVEFLNTVNLIQFFLESRSRPNVSQGIQAIISPNSLLTSILYLISSGFFEGNVIVFKIDESKPILGQKLAKLIQDAGFPPSSFSFLHGDNRVSLLMMKDKRIKRFFGYASELDR